MKLIELVPTEKIFTQNQLRVNPIGYDVIDGQPGVNIYYDKVDTVAEKVIEQGNKVLPFADFVTLTTSTNLDAVNAILSGFDVQAQ